jgi:HAD superfamily hydrolase (TIGR01509 family)
MKIPSHSKAVIFDMDGLIIDSEPYWDMASIEMFYKRGKECPNEFLKTVIGMGMRESSQLLKDTYGFEDSVEDLIAEKREIFYRLFFKNPGLHSGVKELVRNLYEKKIPMAIATMGHNKNKAKHILSVLDLAQFFKLIITSEQVKRGKPYPDVYLDTAEKLGIPAHECLVLEDAPNGVKAGKAAGMVVYGINKDETVCIKLKEAGADAVVRSLKELII